MRGKLVLNNKSTFSKWSIDTFHKQIDLQTQFQHEFYKIESINRDSQRNF